MGVWLDRQWGQLQDCRQACQRRWHAALLRMRRGVRILTPKLFRAGPGAVIQEGVRIEGHVSVGAACRIGRYSHLDGRGRGIRMGQDCCIGEFSVLEGQGRITLGNHVSLGPHAAILSTEARFDDPVAVYQYGDTEAGEVTVGDYVSIGAHVCILGGITIGQGSIVGAGAVVTRSFPKQSVIAGNPARVLPSRMVAAGGSRATLARTGTDGVFG